MNQTDFTKCSATSGYEHVIECVHQQVEFEICKELCVVLTVIVHSVLCTEEIACSLFPTNLLAQKGSSFNNFLK